MSGFPPPIYPIKGEGDAQPPADNWLSLTPEQELNAIRHHLSDAGVLPALREDGSFVNPAMLVVRLWEQRDKARQELAELRAAAAQRGERADALAEAAQALLRLVDTLDPAVPRAAEAEWYAAVARLRATGQAPARTPGERGVASGDGRET